MENTSSETTPEAPAAEKTAPARRSRRATAATGEAVTAPAPAAEAPATTAPTEAPAAPAAEAEAPAPEKAAPVKRTPRTRAAKSATRDADAVSAATEVSEPSASPAADAAEAVAAPKKRVTRSRKKALEAEAEAAAQAAASDAPTASSTASGAEQPAASHAPAAETEAGAEAPAPKKRQTRGRKKLAEADAAAPVADAAAEAVAGVSSAADQTADAPSVNEKNPRNRTRNSQNRRNNGASTEQATAEASTESGEASVADSQNTEQKGADAKQSDAKSGDAQLRNNRTRQRDRKRRGQGDEFEMELHEDDVLLPIAGILDVLDNYAFVRTSGYLPGTNDVYVSLGQVKKYDLRKGDAVVGAIRQPREGEGNGRQKYNAIVRVDSVNSRLTEEQQTRADFAQLTPISSDTQLILETAATETMGRVLDLFAPLGAGQRTVVRGAAGTGKTSVLRTIADAVSANTPETHLMFVALDARPEEITELQRSVKGEVIASAFDRPVEDHITAAELAVERAKRLVELGHDVVLLLDSVTRLGRAYQQAFQSHSRTPVSGFDVNSQAPLKRLLAAARNIENGGSLTIVATANDHSVSQIDELILEEIAGVWNSEIQLSAELSSLAAFPAVVVAASRTRNAAELHGAAAETALVSVRRAAVELGVVAASAALSAKLASTASNVEFLAVAQRQPGL